MAGVNRWIVGEWDTPFTQFVTPESTFENAEELTQHGSYDCGWCGGFIPEGLGIQCIGETCGDMVYVDQTYFICPACNDTEEYCKRCEYVSAAIYEYKETHGDGDGDGDSDVDVSVDIDTLWSDDVPKNKPETFRKVWDTEPPKEDIEDFITTYMSDDTVAFIAAYKDAKLQYFDIFVDSTWKRYLNKNRAALALNRRDKTNFGSGGRKGSIKSLPADALEMIVTLASGCNFPILLV